MSNIEAFRNLPEINFINKSVEKLIDDMVVGYEQAYFEATGENKTLAQGDPVRIWIISQALRIYQAYLLIDYTGKQNLLKYAEGDAVDHIGARVGAERLPSKPAITTVRFSLSAAQTNVVTIPEGTRVTPGNNIFFATTEYAEIPAGETYIDITLECTKTGTIGNNFVVGQINTLVDPIPFVESVESVDKSQGGADKESDENMKERIYLKPESFSTAGPEEAYEFFVREYSQTIDDVAVYSPSPGTVDIRFLFENGEIPGATTIDNVSVYLSDKKRRPLTDNVVVSAPTQVNYDIDLTYYISKENSEFATAIQQKVNQAIEEYKLWQKSKIGRDINSDELVYRIKEAGAKRVEIITPVFTTVQSTEVAISDLETITYGGLEDE